MTNKVYGPLESFITYQPKMEPKQKLEEEQTTLDDFLEEKVDSLSGILQRIKKEIHHRYTLSEKVVHDIYQHYVRIRSKILGIKGNPSAQTTGSSLEQQLDTLKQETRSERVRCWQDIDTLKKEFRTWLKQYLDVAQRVRLLLPPMKKKR